MIPTLCFQDFRQTLMTEGKSNEEIELKIQRRRRRNTKVILNRTLRKGKHEGAPDPIIWDCDDPSIHSFEVTDPEDVTHKVTIATYFKERYNMPLKFPRGPAIYVKDGRQDAYFPIEFFEQAFGKVKGADMNRHVLAFNDEFASTERLRHLENVKAEVENVLHRTGGQDLATLLQQFHIHVEDKPMELQATVLKQPTIEFSRSNKEPRDGSWDLRDAVFPVGAHLTSYGYLDLDGEGSPESMKTLFRVMDKHGIEMPRPDDLTKLTADLRVVEKSQQPEMVRIVAHD